jgi:hypothetical protein
MRDMLLYMKSVLGARLEITNDIVSLYFHTLYRFDDNMVIEVIKELCGRWKQSGIPRAAVIFDICDERTPKGEDEAYADDLRRNEAEYQSMKNRHRPAVRDFIKRILNDEPLSEEQKARKQNIELYMESFHGERDPKKELRDLTTPYSISYTGLYMYALEGTLKQLTGEKKGNLFGGEG